MTFLIFFLCMTVTLGIERRMYSAVDIAIDKKEAALVGAAFLFAVVFTFLKQYWYIYFILAILLFSVFGALRAQRLSVYKQQAEAVFEILRKMVGIKDNQDLNMADAPFELHFKNDAINQIDVTVEPTTFKPKSIDFVIMQLNNFLPDFNWKYELQLNKRKVIFIGENKPPTVARWPGSWLRPAKMFPIGISGKGELVWRANSVDGDEGKSQFGDIKTDKTISAAPQGLIAGGPLSVNTIVPTTKGYKKMKDVTVGDYVFDVHNRPAKVIAAYSRKMSNILYRLTFADESGNMEVVYSDEVHRFPRIIEKQGLFGKKTKMIPTACRYLEIDDTIIGNNGSFALVEKEQAANEEVKCITVSSKEHVFLITSTISDDWHGGDSYPYSAIYTFNTGGGKAIWIEQEIDEQ